MFFDDYYKKGPFTEAEEKSLAEDIYSAGLPTKEEYIAALEAAGYTEIQWMDKTNDWTAFCQQRFAGFQAGKERFVRVHSEATYENLLFFYQAVVRVFEGGHLGGVRCRARKGAGASGSTAKL